MFITAKRKTRAKSDPDTPNSVRGLLETCNAEEPGQVKTLAGFTHGDRRFKAVAVDCAFVKPI
jgi:hypothetical protein